MVARTSREILRWLEGLYLTYPIIVPRWDLSNGFAYAEILHAYYPNEINMLSYINGRSINSRLLNWALIKQFLKKKRIPISNDIIDATNHGKDGGAEKLLEQTYQILTNKIPYTDGSTDQNSQFTDQVYQKSLSHVHRSNTTRSLKTNLKLSELETDPSIAYQTNRSANIQKQSKWISQTSRVEYPERFGIRPTLAEQCLRKPLRRKSNAEEWLTRSFESFAQPRKHPGQKKNTQFALHQSMPASTEKPSHSQINPGMIEIDEDVEVYKEIVLKQHAVPPMRVEFI